MSRGVQVLTNIGRLLTCPAGGDQGSVGAIESAALAWDDARVVWVGPEAELPDELRAAKRRDARGRLVIPGLVDCHTHLAFGGSRSDEFEKRLLGWSYLDIAKQGGGIRRTVRETRSLEHSRLVERGLAALRAMAQLGVTTVECKSGYGLTTETELELLRVYEQLRALQPLRLVSTFLGAHVVPPEFDGDRAGYVRLVREEMLPRVAAEGLAEFCDVFVEEGAFSPDDARAILATAAELGLRGKLHVDQLHDGGGGELAAETGALSADHLEHLSEDGVEAMARAGVVAVALPFASFFLHQPPMPGRRLIEAGVPLAIATDFNPGTAPSYHLPLAMLLACVRQGLSAGEAVKGATRFAAQALGREDEVGSLEPGYCADFALVDASHEQDWLFRFTANAVIETVVGGATVWSRDGSAG